MKAKRIPILAAIAGAAAVAFAAPASADLTDGTYQMTYSDGAAPPSTWVVTSCGAGCKRLQRAPYEPLDYHLQGNTWTATSSEGKVQTIDNNTLAGSSNGNAYQLVKVG